MREGEPYITVSGGHCRGMLAVPFSEQRSENCRMGAVSQVACHSSEGEKWIAVMDVWLGLGIFLLAAGVGALLTAIAYSSRIRKLRAEIEAANEKDRRAA